MRIAQHCFISVPRASFKPAFRLSSWLHMLCIANSTSRMFSIKTIIVIEFTRTACFKRATHRFTLRALTIASRFFLGFRAAKMSRPIALMTSSAMMVTYPLSFIPSRKRPHSSSVQFHIWFLCRRWTTGSTSTFNGCVPCLAPQHGLKLFSEH